MEDEKSYLLTGLKKSGYIIFVSSIFREGMPNRRRFDYISDNCADYGISADSVLRGYRLPEDYIHPDDRAAFVDAFMLFEKNHVDFSYFVRVVGDDGIVRKSNVDVVLLDSDVDHIKVEFIVHEIGYNETLISNEDEGTPIDVDGDGIPDLVIGPEFLHQNGVEQIVQGVAAMNGLYSALLDLDGKVLIKPEGPQSYLGEFYRLIEDPKYREHYLSIVKRLEVNGEAIFDEVDDGNPDSRLSAAPLYLDGKMFAVWILYAYSKKQVQSLFKVYERHFTITKDIGIILSQIYRGKKGLKDNDERKAEMEFEIEQKKVMSEVLEAVYASDAKAMDRAIDKVGRLLDIDYMIYYGVSNASTGSMRLVDYWSRYGKTPEIRKKLKWTHERFSPKTLETLKATGLVIDHRNMTNQMRVETFEGGARAVMEFPVKIAGKYVGRCVYLENSRERNWTESEISFAKELASLIARRLKMRDIERYEAEWVRPRYLDQVFETMEPDVFIRDQKTGAVLYANAALSDKLGGKFEGKDSFRLIPQITEEFEGLAGRPIPSANKGSEISRYTRYINELGGNFDVTEIKTTWRDGKPAEILIISPLAETK